ncbi:MAG: VWA domain-containing protein [Planctomycetes bacterium]|nr:VWA domain-containing protein [Planctomycetota bacterium]
MPVDGVTFDFRAPWYLLLLGLLPLVWWLARRSLTGLSMPRRWCSLALRAAVLLLMVLALAETRLLKRNERLAVIFVIDRSESIPAEQREAARQYVVETARARDERREDMVGVVAFGKVAGIEVLPRPEPLELESFVTLIEPDATDMAAAVRLAVAAFPEGTGKRIVLLSDGNENRESVLEEVRNARAQGVTVDVVPIAYSYDAEVSLEKLLVDPEVNVGQPFRVRVVVDSTRETEANLRLFEDGVLVSGADARLKLRPGRNVFDFERRFDLSGKHDFEARVEPLSPADDGVLQNNSAFGFTFIQGEPRVLLCAEEPELDQPLVEALNAEKIAVKVVTPDFLPRAIEEYYEYQAIILSNVGAHELSEEQMLIFESLVKSVGLGFAMIGGEDSFGAGGYQGTPVERLLPVDMEIKQRKVLPNGALAMVVHSCELGNGNFWARQVIQKAIAILSPRDYAGVLYFDNRGQDTWLFPMTPVSQRQMMLSRLRGFDPGDMMSFQGIMQMALTGLQSTPASIKHMIVLSDGDPSMPAARLVNAIRAQRITNSTICYGAHGGIPPGMQQLAQQGGGKFYYLQSPQDLPEIFVREATTVQKALISEERFVPNLHSRGALLQGIDADLPPLDGYVLTSPKELASLLILHPPGAEDPTQDPVLAAWTYGLGKSIAFTSDAGRRWGKDWARWSGYQRFWGQCVRWISRQRSEDRFRITRSIEGDVGLVTIDAITPDGQFVNGLQFEGKVVSPDFESQAVAVRQVSPGRYVAELPASKRGTYTVSMSYERGGQPSTLLTGLSVPYSAEYRRLETNREVLRQVAAAGGGKYHEDPAAAAENADFFARDFPVTREVQDVWRALLAAAVVLFFADVFVRRVVVDYRKVALEGLRRAAALVRGRPRAAAPSDARLATLLERKAKLREAAAARYQPRRGEAAAEGRKAAPPPAAAAAATDATVALAPGAGAGAAAPPAAPGRKAAEERREEKAEEASYTARLLEAKRRALRREKGDGSK